MSAGKVLLGLLAGISVGAVLGILYAPEKGSSTRKKISNNSNDYLNNLSAKFDDFIDGVSKKVDNAKDDVDKMAARGKAKVEELDGRFSPTSK
jgi:gas vesicle protein